MRYILFRLFGWEIYDQKQMNDIRANWFCVGESYGMNKTIDYLEKIGYTSLAIQLRKEMTENNNRKGIKPIRFDDLRGYIGHALDTE